MTWSCGACGAIFAKATRTSCPSCGYVFGTPPPSFPAPEPVAEPVTAWRIWRVKPALTGAFVLRRSDLQRLFDAVRAGMDPLADLTGARLQGIGVDQVWKTAALDATCARGDVASFFPSAQPLHEAPHRACSCGIWALKDEEEMYHQLARYAAHDRSGGGGTVYAYGRVQLWGRIFEHRLGWRAQHARPVEITVLSDDETVLELASFYRCPVTGTPTPQWLEKVIDQQMRAIGDAQVKASVALIKALPGQAFPVLLPAAAARRQVGSRIRCAAWLANAWLCAAALAIDIAFHPLYALIAIPFALLGVPFSIFNAWQARPSWINT